MKIIGSQRLQVFSISIQLKERQSVALSCTVGEDGSIEATGDPTCFVSQEHKSAENYVKLYGTIDARIGPCIIALYFKHELENPKSIDPENDTIPLWGPCSYCPFAWDLDMRFHLRDAHRDLEISRGWLENKYNNPPACYYDKRLSSVVKGEHGWATMRYTLFSNAIQANVSVKLVVNEDRGCSSCVVFGSLFVRYSGHDYRYEYQRKYYQTVLFRKSLQDGVSLVDGNSLMLPLSVALVAVPVKTSLIIVADLHVMCGETLIADVITNNDAEIPQPSEIDSSSSKIVMGDNAHLEVTASWSDCW